MPSSAGGKSSLPVSASTTCSKIISVTIQKIVVVDRVCHRARVVRRPSSRWSTASMPTTVVLDPSWVCTKITELWRLWCCARATQHHAAPLDDELVRRRCPLGKPPRENVDVYIDLLLLLLL